MAFRRLGLPRNDPIPEAEEKKEESAALARVEPPPIVHIPQLMPEPRRAVIIAPPKLRAQKVVGANHLKAGERLLDALILSGAEPESARLWIHWFLHSVCGRAQPKDDHIKPELQALLHEFEAIYYDQFGDRPNLGIEERGLATKLLRDHGPGPVIAKLRTLAAIQDPFIRQMGFSFKTVSTQWSRLAAQTRASKKIADRAAPSDCTHMPRCQTATEHTQRWLHDATGSPSPVTASQLRTALKQSARSSDP